MGKLASKFMDTKTFYNLSVLAAPKARCFSCRKWFIRNHLFRNNGKRYCASCTPSDTFNQVIGGNYHRLPPQHILNDESPLL